MTRPATATRRPPQWRPDLLVALFFGAGCLAIGSAAAASPAVAPANGTAHSNAIHITYPNSTTVIDKSNDIFKGKSKCSIFFLDGSPVKQQPIRQEVSERRRKSVQSWS